MQNDSTNFPIAPKRFPFFYGWFIVFAGTLGILVSVPGQTMGVSVFTDYFIDALKISRDQLSFAYMTGTISSSFFLTQAGKWYDKYGARIMIVFATVLLAIAVVLLSYSPQITAYLRQFGGMGSVLFSTIGVMSVLFFLLRFSGQGMVTMFSRTMIMKWFDQRRGLANAISSAFVSVGFSLAPLLFAGLIDFSGWENAYRMIGVIVILFCLFAALFYRDNPEECGLIPDGVQVKPQASFKKTREERQQYTLTEAKKTVSLWGITLSTAYFSFFMSGFTFHVVSIFKSVDMSKEQALYIFVPATIISVILSFASSALSDYIKITKLLFFYLLGAAMCATGLIFLGDNVWYWVLIGGIGITNGLYTVLMAVALPRYFGREHLGAISGFNMAAIVFASALAPLFFSLCNSQFGNYSVAGMVCAVLTVGLVLLSLKIKNPQHN